MTLEQLLVLETIVREGSFRAASEKLNKVQSAVSYAIKTLEGELGFQVFSRDGYRPVLTPAGSAIHRRAALVLEEVDELTVLAGHLRRGEEPLFRMDVAPTAPMAHLVRHLRQVSRDFPATKLDITSETFGAESLVAEGRVDLAITDVIDPEADLETKIWRETRLLAVAAAEHPLARLTEDRLTRSRTRKYVQVVVSSGRMAGDKRSRGVLGGVSTWTVADFEAKKTLLLSGMGWGNMPEHLLQDELFSGSLKRLCIPGLEETTVVLRAVRKRSQVHGPVAQRIWQLLDERPEDSGAGI